MKKNLFRFTTLIMLLLTAFVLVGCGEEKNTSQAQNAYVVIDINPSIEIVTNEDGKVMRVTALNEDAQLLLLDVDLSGKTFDEAVEVIIELAKELGYINELDENAILFTVEADEERTVEELTAFLKEKVTKFKDKHKLRVECLIEQLSKDPELINEAKELDISVNKLALIKAAMEIDLELTIEEARKLPVKDILKIVADTREDVEGIFDEENLSVYYHRQKLMASTMTLKEVELINEVIQNADDAVFMGILEGTDTTVQAVKDLYQEYFNKINDVIANYTNEIDEPEETDITEEEQILIDLIKTLTEEKDNIELAIEALLNEFTNADRKDPNFKEVRSQFKNQLHELQNQRKDIIVQVKELIKDLDDNFKNQKQHGKINRGPWFPINDLIADRQNGLNHSDIVKLLREIRVEYEDKFKEIGIDLNQLEGLFIEQLRTQIEEARTQIKEEFEETKKLLKESSKEAKEKLRNRKKQLKDLFA